MVPARSSAHGFSCSRRISPLSGGNSIYRPVQISGTSSNIIPDDVVLAGTIRSFKPEVRAKMLAGIERTVKVVAAMSRRRSR